MGQSVVVGLSGGIDSFVTALLLQKEGFEVYGINLQLWGKSENPELDALCKRVGISLQRYDGRDLFLSQVVDVFVREYSDGCTPNPCTLCNNVVKWNLLKQVADELGIEKIATGHYVKIRPVGQHMYICKGNDPVKDQSYFLWGIKEEFLRRAITPLGEYTKARVRILAEEYGYSDLVRQKESMGICFLEGRDYRDFILHYSGCAPLQSPGDILDAQGKVIGRHSGLLNYTVGQRRGIPLIAGKQMYVKAIMKQINAIVVDSKDRLFRNVLEVEQLNLIDRADLRLKNIEVKVRGLGLNPEGYANMEELSEERVRVHLESPAWALAPGQPVTFYCGDRLLGGGILSGNQED